MADVDNRTPRDVAAFYGRRKACQALLDQGATGRIDLAAVRALVDRPSRDGELAIWYLGNSGWAIRSANHLLIIDFVPGGADVESSLLNGQIVAEELPDLPITILVSHHHTDHFSPRILDIADGRDVRFVFGWDAPIETPGHRFTEAGEATLRNIRVAAIPSTDTGSAFLIEANGFRIYHAGDHTAAETPPEEAFTSGIAELARFAPVDLAFVPIFGCGLPNVESLRGGNDWTIERLAPRAVFPIHVRWTGHFYREEKHRLEALGLHRQVVATSLPGDRYLYRDGRVDTLAPLSQGD